MKELLDYVENFLKNFYHRILTNTFVSTDELAISRILVGFYFLLIDRPSYSWINEVPSSFFDPPILSLANLFSGFPPAIYFIITDYLIIVLLVFIIIGLYSRYSFFIIFILLIVNNSFAYSFGKIDHAILGTLLFLFFGFTNAGSRFSIKKDKVLICQNLAIIIFSLSIVFGYFTAGYQKFNNWIDFDLNTSGILSWFYPSYFEIISNDSIAKYMFLIPKEFLEILDYLVPVFEISGIIFLLISYRTWLLYLFLACLFHLGNSLLLNIPFTIHAMVFGIWLLNPLLLKHKWIIAFFLPGIFPDAVTSGILVWTGLITLSSINYFYFYKKRNEEVLNNSYLIFELTNVNRIEKEL
jgi:uncharacterized membrane protein YphA (DoxX/SURF4 family)